MNKIGFKRSKDVKSHSIYEAQKKNKTEDVQMDNKTKTNIFHVVYPNHANDFLYICKTELLYILLHIILYIVNTLYIVYYSSESNKQVIFFLST